MSKSEAGLTRGTNCLWNAEMESAVLAAGKNKSRTTKALFATAEGAFRLACLLARLLGQILNSLMGQKK